MNNLSKEPSEALKENNITEAIIGKLKEEFLPLKIQGLNDVVGYGNVSVARKKCRDIRVLATKLCKAGREDAIRIQKEWIAKEKDIVGQVKVVEDHLSAQEDWYVSEHEKIQILEQRKAALPGRLEKLSTYKHDITEEQILDMDEEMFENCLKHLWEESQQRIAANNRLKAEQLEKELRAIEDQKVKQAEALQKEKDAIEEQKRKIIEDRTRNRQKELSNLGFVFDAIGWTYGNLVIANTELEQRTDEEWAATMETTKGAAAVVKKGLEDQEIARQEKIKQDAIENARLEAAKETERKEKEKIAEQERIAELEEKAEIERKRKEAAAPDREKIWKWWEEVKKVPMGDPQTDQGKEAFSLMANEMEVMELRLIQRMDTYLPQ